MCFSDNRESQDNFKIQWVGWFSIKRPELLS